MVIWCKVWSSERESVLALGSDADLIILATNDTFVAIFLIHRKKGKETTMKQW